MRLEVGPGFSPIGDFYRGLYRFNPRVVGCDVIYMDLYPPATKMGEWVVGDCRLMPFRDNVFSDVYASHVIEHLDEPARFFSESNRVLRRGGRLWLWTPNFLSWNAVRDPDHKHVFNFINIRMASRYGFSVHYVANVASRLPKPLRYLFKLLFLVFCDELAVSCLKI